MSSVEPTWQDLPFVFKRSVFSTLDLKTRCSLRLCSKNDKEIVDSCPVSMKNLEISIAHANGFTVQIQETVNPLHTISLKLQIPDILQIFQLHHLKIQDVKIFSTCKQFYQVSNLISELSFLVKSDSRFKIHAKNFYWRCSDSETADEFITLLECFHENVLKMIHNNMSKFSNNQMVKLAKLEQWKNLKEIWLENGEVTSVNPFLNVNNCTVYFKNLKPGDIWKMIQSFLSRNSPIGSSFDFHSEQPVKMVELLKIFNVEPNNQPIFPDDIGVENRHTQRFDMTTQGNFLVVKNTEIGIRGTVQKIE